MLAEFEDLRQIHAKFGELFGITPQYMKVRTKINLNTFVLNIAQTKATIHALKQNSQ